MSNAVPAAGDPVLCLLGPTASGKTEAAIRLHERGDVDIISVDSAMVYRGLDIGSAKPAPALLARVPHALVDIRAPTDSYSVAEFVDDATRLIRDSHTAGRIPVLVGGTMLYFKCLFNGLADLPEADPAIRSRLDAEAEADGWPALHARLAVVDSQAAGRIEPTDSQRIQRALEVFGLTGTPISVHQQRSAARPRYRYCSLALASDDRASLHARINQRFDTMLEQGLLDEVADLLRQPGVHTDLPSLRAVGYRQLADHLAGHCSLEQAVKDAKTATRRLAKRQFTWLRGMPDIEVVDPLDSPVFDHIHRWVGQQLGA